MHPKSKRHPLGQTLLAAGLLGLSAVGCSEAPQGTAPRTAEQQIPHHIPVPHKTVAVAAINHKGDVTEIIAITEDGNAASPTVCEIKGSNKCPFEFPDVVTAIQIGKVAYDTQAGVEPISIPGIANAVAAGRKCVFAIKVGNKVYYYLAPCTP